MNKIYSINHYSFIDKIIIKKRQEMCDLINNELRNFYFIDALDIGTTNDTKNKSSNYLIKNLKNINIYKSVSNQKIKKGFFSKNLNKSITDNFSQNEIKLMKSDLVISNATIEHVGSFDNQVKMIKNMVSLSKKFFIVITPNRFYPIDFHTKMPLIHWLPKNLHRKILKFLSLNFYSKEENLNLLSKKDLVIALMRANINNYKIFEISLLGFISNLIVIGKVKNK